ncbi:ATP-dependent helicase [uncultured Photobacterium sp.]|uniref:UvrD-helicase domain-containing protein n=1 Tax=uncultured Photobacterium sp. TaxID=173973 RepID=UPI0026054EA6|nr:ATP-dependent helicase [uncultured Photobacterium sp.]
MLNPDQQLVVDAEGHVMVVAIPGSGKTEVSSRYAERKLLDDTANVIAMLTFTDAAARGMGARLDKNLSRSIRSRAISSTFHSCAIKLWRQAYSSRPILMGVRQEMLIERVMREVSSRQLKLSDGVAIIDEMGRELKLKRSKHTKAQLRLFDAYCTLRDKEGYTDFNEISRQVILGMREGRVPSLMDTDGVTHICADEFQDSDPLQYHFLLEHARRGVTIITVGDDDQSIYRFRNACGFENFVNFQQDLGATAYSLKICYRCYPRILETADRLISFNEERIDKVLSSHFPSGGNVTVTGFDTEESQTSHIISSVLAKPREVAVLARTNLELDGIELMLSSMTDRKITRLGGKSFWENMHAIGYLQAVTLATNPFKTELLPEILGYMQSCESVIDEAKAMIANKLSRDDIFQQLLSRDNLNGSVRNYLHYVISKSLPATADGQANAEWQRELVLFLSQSRYLKSTGIAGSISDVLTKKAKGMGSLYKAVNDMANNVLFYPTKKNTVISPDDIVISTLHGSKGLEFGRVYIINIHENKIPAEDKDGLGLEHIEEERRLFFVGITRAEKELNMSFVKEPSFFLKECELELTKQAIRELNLKSQRPDMHLSHAREMLVNG